MEDVFGDLSINEQPAMEPEKTTMPCLPVPPLEMTSWDQVPQDAHIFIKGGKVLVNGAKTNIRFNSRNFGRGPSQQRTNPSQPPSRAGNSSPSAYSPSSLAPPNVPAGAPSSPSATAATMQVNEHAHQSNQGNRRPPFFFREEYATYIVKGNFMTLAAKPHLVEEGEWMAHQISEQNRVLGLMVKIVQEVDRNKGLPTCNEQSCPTMSAGITTYTWVDTNRNPINLPAPTYIKHIQTWVSGKIQDEALFPTQPFQSPPTLPNPQQATNDTNHWLGKTSGFPQRFDTEIKNMYKQMFRCYAHLYWSHWLDFWNLSAHRELNTCFVHFVNVGRIFGLLSDKDTEPMQPLIDLWIRKGDLPQSKEVEGAPAPGAASTSTAPSSVAPPGAGGPST